MYYTFYEPALCIYGCFCTSQSSVIKTRKSSLCVDFNSYMISALLAPTIIVCARIYYSEILRLQASACVVCSALRSSTVTLRECVLFNFELVCKQLSNILFNSSYYAATFITFFKLVARFSLVYLPFKTFYYASFSIKDALTCASEF